MQRASFHRECGYKIVEFLIVRWHFKNNIKITKRILFKIEKKTNKILLVS